MKFSVRYVCQWILLAIVCQDGVTQTLLTIGAIDVIGSNHSQRGSIDTSQFLNITSSWADRLEVKIIWSFIGINEDFALIRKVRAMLNISSIDVMVVNDAFFDAFQKNNHLVNKSVSVLFYQSKLSPFTDETVTSRFSYDSKCLSPSSNLEEVHTELDYCNEMLITPNETPNGLLPPEVDVLNAVLKHLQWQQLILIFDEETALDIQMISTSLSENSSEFIMFSPDNFTDGHSVHTMLHDAYHKRAQNDELHFVLFCSGVCVSTVIHEAIIFDDIVENKTALKVISQWLLILPQKDHHILEACAKDLDNVAVITYPPPAPSVGKSMTEGLPIELYKILNKLGSQNTTETIPFSVIRHNISELFIQALQAQSYCWRSELKTLYYKPGRSRQLNSVGYVNRSGHVTTYSNIFPNTKYGLNRKKFKVSTNIWPPFVNKTETNGTVVYTGFCIELLKEMAKSLNFTYELVEPEDGDWGVVYNTSLWSGLIGQLQRKEVDLIAAPIAIEPEREKVMDFIFPFFYEYTTVLLKKPHPNKTKWRTLIDPFKWHVLLCIGISLVFTTMFFFLLERWNPYYSREKYHGRTRGGHIFGDAFWYMYGALLTQGGEHLPDSQTGRTVVSTWWLFSIVMAATYSGNLIAFLTVTKDKLPFDTLEAMVNQDEYKWGTVGGTIWPLIFKTSNGSVYKKVWSGMQSFNATDPSILSTDTYKHLNKVKAGGYAYIGDRSMIEVWLADECDLQFIKEQFLPMQYALGLPQNSPYKQQFRNEMLQIYESGLLQIWKKKLWPKNSFCKGSLTTNAKPITIIDVQSAFYMIGIGIFGAAMALLVEWIFHQRMIPKSHLPRLPTMSGHVK